MFFDRNLRADPRDRLATVGFGPVEFEPQRRPEQQKNTEMPESYFGGPLGNDGRIIDEYLKAQFMGVRTDPGPIGPQRHLHDTTPAVQQPFRNRVAERPPNRSRCGSS